MNLTDDIMEILANEENDPGAFDKVAETVLSADETPESTALLALMYHDGMGVAQDFGKCFELTKRAALEGDDGLGYYLLGYMCDNLEIPNQTCPGVKEQFSQLDAVRYYEKCAVLNCRWSDAAHLWLGNYYMDSARGGDMDVAVKHYETLASYNAEAAGRLSDYYWDQRTMNAVVPEEFRDVDLETKIYKWTLQAVELNPHDYSFRMGWIHADGIGCNKSFRLARKYWEDAYEFGDPHAADAIVTLFEERLSEIPDTPDNADERAHCLKSIASWRKLAALTRARRQS